MLLNLFAGLKARLASPHKGGNTFTLPPHKVQSALAVMLPFHLCPESTQTNEKVHSFMKSFSRATWRPQQKSSRFLPNGVCQFLLRQLLCECNWVQMVAVSVERGGLMQTAGMYPNAFPTGFSQESHCKNLILPTPLWFQVIHTPIAAIPHEPGKQNFTASYVHAKLLLRKPFQLAAGKPNSKLQKSSKLVLTEDVFLFYKASTIFKAHLAYQWQLNLVKKAQKLVEE